MSKKASRSLGEPDDVHVAAAQHAIAEAWNDLERMPPTCYGGIRMASRALANAEKGLAHAWAISYGARAQHNELFGLGNKATKAAWDTIQFFGSVCEAPNRAAADRPLFSRVKYKKELEAREKKTKRGRR
jgi:hypothetical protein